MKILPVLTVLAIACAAQAEEIKSVKSFYYGNSFTGNTMPGLHPLLGKSAGKEWTNGASIAAGVPMWVHMKGVMDKKEDPMKGMQGDWDVVVGQVFAGEGLEHVTDSMWQGKVKFDKPTDIGDIAALTLVFSEFIKAHPAARAYLYTSWPGIPMEELATSGKVQVEKAGGNEKFNKKGFSEEKMEEFRKAFDYEKAWLVEAGAMSTGPRPHVQTHTRGHMYAAMEGVKKNMPELWSSGRLGMIPVGDVFLALDKKMKAGEVPGLVNIGQYLSNGHLRSGLPRYTLAATFFAVLFKEHPGKTAIDVYGDKANYESKKFGYYVHQPDLGVHVEITPERKKLVDDTIWEVVTRHPYTQVKGMRP